MNQDERNELYKKAFATFGINAQLEIAIEELAELQLELIHFKRYRGSDYPQLIFRLRRAAKEEIADVEIMIEQMRLMFETTPGEIDDIKNDKLVRLKTRILKNKLNG